MNYVALLKRCLLFFWASWLALVFLTNLADAARSAGMLGEEWAFASGNFKAIQETTARYGMPAGVNGVLFAGVIIWEGIAAVLFCRAGWRYRGGRTARREVYAAFTVSLCLWAGFIIADEIFIAYALSGVHLRLFVAHLTTLLAIELLPEQ